LALFAGAGGGILGSKLLGWRTICAVELEKFPRSVLLARQRDGCLDRFPIWDDVCTFDGTIWRGHIHIISGGFPCQDVSVAGSGKGLAGGKSGLWFQFARIVGEVCPLFVFVENSPALVSRGLSTVLYDLDEMGYDAVWGVFDNARLGGPQYRNRLFLLAHSRDRQNDVKLRIQESRKESVKLQEKNRAIAKSIGLREGVQNQPWPIARVDDPQSQSCTINAETRGMPPLKSGVAKSGLPSFPPPPRYVDMANGLAPGVDNTKAIGNGQVPRMVVSAWETLSKTII
jgi:DNA (cytosine-5)-methyltransferase 1